MFATDDQFIVALSNNIAEVDNPLGVVGVVTVTEIEFDVATQPFEFVTVKLYEPVELAV